MSFGHHRGIMNQLAEAWASLWGSAGAACPLDAWAPWAPAAPAPATCPAEGNLWAYMRSHAAATHFCEGMFTASQVRLHTPPLVC